ncbi:MAG TPA: PIG-L family deacetylase [Vicinamibacterales bacterium]|nr:PIG-L family deacetylase [Vicinamibacterales bacterium]
MMRHVLALSVCLWAFPYATHEPHAPYATYVAHAAQVQGAPQPGTFTFRDGRSRVIDLTIADIGGISGIVWPEVVDARFDTALLGVQINADATAAAPYIEIAAGGTSDRQYFPAGDAGERWLNVTFLRGAVVGTRISLRGDGVTFGAPAARLRLFERSHDLSKAVLVLAPHPDDAEIAAFGLYANRNATVVTVTAGNAGSPTYEAVFDDPGEQYLFKGRIRVIDSITIPWQGGIPPERAFNMGYFDARLAEMHDKRDTVVPEMYRPNTDVNVYRRENVGSLLPLRSRESSWRNLVEDTLTVLKKVKPAVIVAPHPQLDSHRDHQYTTIALSEALARWNRPVTLLLYTNHADRNRYPYGPAGTLLSLPPPPPGNVVIDRVYSHPVSTALQRLKLFALESMHDLRFTPTRQYQLARQELRAMAPEKPGSEPDITYLRRGPRSNELFFVYDRESFGAMVKAFLGRL